MRGYVEPPLGLRPRVPGLAGMLFSILVPPGGERFHRGTKPTRLWRDLILDAGRHFREHSARDQLRGEPQRRLAGANLGNPTSPTPCGAGHLFTNARRAKARPRAGTEGAQRFCITACITTKTLSAPRASHESIPMRRALGSYSGYAVTPPRPVFCAVIQGIAAETSSRILADFAKPAKASRATETGTWPS